MSVDVTTLKVLARMASGLEGPNARFKFVSIDTQKVLCSCSTLEELHECILKLDPEIIKNHLCSCDEFDSSTGASDLAFYVHYVFGDAELSMKIYSLAEKFSDNPEKLKLELCNLLFTRLLNFSEIAVIPD